ARFHPPYCSVKMTYRHGGEAASSPWQPIREMRETLSGVLSVFVPHRAVKGMPVVGMVAFASIELCFQY
ncbi:MAG: hypothetical protein KAV82_04900, partial [Phycisphaerae bacterium]|nr:hypothetical protein [Phycisphaerae bacterium]